jgi:hypothetical protein
MQLISSAFIVLCSALQRRLGRAIACASLVGVMFWTAGLCAQQQTGEIDGRVTDASDAAIPGATVTLANNSRGIRIVTTTDNTGRYALPLLPPAEGYEVSVSKAGFKEAKRGGIILQVAQTAQVNIALEVGSSTETVVVTSAAPLLDQETSSIGQVINTTTITNLPLNGRSSFRLIQLTPGVNFNQSAYGQFGDVPVNTTWDTNFSINGGQAQSNEFLIDGIPSSVGFFNQITTIPSVDDTQEFKVESANLSAEYGRFAGGVVNVTTKSGTNEIHGSAFEFLRNNVLNADDYFNKGKGQPTPSFKMNQFGGAVGGPVILPRVYHGRNKTYFFVDYQGTRRVQGASFRGTVPTAQQRAGDFSQTFNSKGQLVTIYNPFSTQIDPSNSKQYIRTAFTGNVIPTTLLDPVAKAIMNYYPLPNAPGAAYTNANNYVSNAPLRVAQSQGSGRIDQNVNDRYHFFGRFGWLLTDLTQPNTFGNIATGGAGAVGTTQFHSWSFAFDNTITVNPTLFVAVNYGFARWFQSRRTLSYGFDASKLGFPTSFTSLINIPMFPSISIAGYSATNGQSYLLNGNDSHSLLASVTKIKGRQNIVMGADLRLHRINFFNVASSAGAFSFANAQTQGPNPNTTSATAGNAFASFLLGVGSSGSMPIGSGNALSDWYMAGYVQDNIHLTNKLTINVGLRYETESPYTDRHNQLNYFSDTVSSPAANPTFPSLKGGLVFAGVNGGSSSVYDWNTKQFGPRAGFAYTPMQNTVIRGGGGIVFAPLELSNNAVGFVPSTGFSSSTNWAPLTSGGLVPQNLLRDPFPQGLVKPAGSSLGAGTAVGQSVSTWGQHPSTPTAYQWNFGIQRQLPWDVLLEGAYVGSRGLHLTHNYNANSLNPSYWSMGTALQATVANPFSSYVTVGNLSNPTIARQQLLLPYPQFTGVSSVNQTWGDSNYHSAQFKFHKRTSHGLSILAVYTFSKWISNVTSQDAPIGTTNNSAVQNWYDLRAERSLAENDIPQALTVNVVGELPVGRGRLLLHDAHGLLEKMVGGWSVSGIITQQNGSPLTMSATTTIGGNRPNWVPGVNPQLPSSRSKADKVAQWFNTSAFVTPAAFTLGNVSRSIGVVRSPGMHNMDLTMVKETQLLEGLHMQFRAEAFNLTNTAHFGLPDTGLSSPTYGQLTTLLPSPWARQIQFAAKFTF